ncbi:MAG: Rrf2 family transcriptional regulator [Myxococcota bacterium]
MEEAGQTAAWGNAVLNLSKRTQLGLYVLVELVNDDRDQRSNEELATSLEVSVNHLAKVMQTLGRVGWIVGSRGVGGGYRMIADPKNISMADVVAVFEGEPNLDDCSLAKGERCDEVAECTIHRVIHEIEEQAYFTLKSVTLHMLAQSGG